VYKSDYILIKDPLHGYIKVYPHEKCVIDSPAFQRLRRIKQLPAAQYVYPGAVHTRFSHSLGVMHVAGEFAEFVYSRLDIEKSELERLVMTARLIGLLHDIGHGPFSHTFEDYILMRYGVNHEVMGGKIIRESPELSQCFDRYIEKEYSLSAEVMSKVVEASTIEFWPLTSRISSDVTERTLYYIIKGPYSADLIDYILRDSLYTGANYGLGLDWTRLLHNSIAKGDNIYLEYKAKDVLDHLLIARLYMFKTVYFHKTARAFDKVMGDLLIRIDDILNFGEAISDVNRYVMLDDDYVLSHPDVRSTEEAKYLLNRLVPYKVIYESMEPVHGSLSALVRLVKRVAEENLIMKLKELGANIDSSAIFVDTPKLPTNPMFEDVEIGFVMPDGVIERRSVRDTAIGLMPKEIAFFRVYLHVKYSKFIDIAKKLASRIFKGSELRSFY